MSMSSNQADTADNVRKTILNHMSENGGHVGPPLGAVEIIQALLDTYDFTHDKIFFDVGHQSHAYKILTDRAARFGTMDKAGGIGIFPSPYESPYDFYTGGHSGLAISAALGYSLGHPEYKSIAIIGDGSLTGGQPYEALNHAGSIQSNILVIFNDNGFSITPNVGSLHTKKSVRKFSESLGFEYRGVIDGHDYSALVQELILIKESENPIFLHVKTIKGKGYTHAELNPTKFHSVPPFDIHTGELKNPENNEFRDYMIAKGESIILKYPSAYFTSPAAMRSSGLLDLQIKAPNNVIDTGMNEQHCVTFSAGLALNGSKVLCVIPALFLPRAFDQLIDVALLHVPMVFIILNPGIGATGPTHQGIYTYPMVQMLPNVELYNPITIEDFDLLIDKSLISSGPVFIQKPTINIPHYSSDKPVAMCLDGDEATIISIGNLLGQALKAAKQIPGIRVLHCNQILPAPIDDITSLLVKDKPILVLEDGLVNGGVGATIMNELVRVGYSNIAIMGVRDVYPTVGPIDSVLDDVGCSSNDIIIKLKEMGVA